MDIKEIANEGVNANELVSIILHSLEGNSVWHSIVLRLKCEMPILHCLLPLLYILFYSLTQCLRH